MEYPPLKTLSSYFLHKELKDYIDSNSHLENQDELTKKLLIWNYANQYSDFYLLGSVNFFTEVLNKCKDYLNWELLSKEVNKTISIDYILESMHLPWQPEHFYMK
jgi:hypothetical protein